MATNNFALIFYPVCWSWLQNLSICFLSYYTIVCHHFLFICFEFCALKCYSNLVSNKIWEFIALDCHRKRVLVWSTLKWFSIWVLFFLYFVIKKLYFNLKMSNYVKIFIINKIDLFIFLQIHNLELYSPCQIWCFLWCYFLPLRKQIMGLYLRVARRQCMDWG